MTTCLALDARLLFLFGSPRAQDKVAQPPLKCLLHSNRWHTAQTPPLSGLNVAPHAWHLKGTIMTNDH